MASVAQVSSQLLPLLLLLLLPYQLWHIKSP
jgi:hypothetical protein